MFCKQCGNAMGNEEKTCPKCGFSYELEGQESAVEMQQTEEIGPAIDGDISSQKPSAKKTKLIIAIASCAVVLLVGGLILLIVLKKPKVDFEKVYAECSLYSPYASVGSDNSYLMIDTNPYDVDKDDMDFDELCSTIAISGAIREVNEHLGLPDYLYEDMERTTALQGKQSQKYEEIGIEVTWSYHPDNGLEVRYRLL